MAKRNGNRLTQKEIETLIVLWDLKRATAYKLGRSVAHMNSLIGFGFVRGFLKKPLSYVGSEGVTIYELTPRGKREMELTGKRKTPITNA